MDDIVSKNIPSTVYVVDDDASVRKSLVRLLRTENIITQTFDSAQDFLDNVILTQPSCMLLDIRMPGMDGLELQRCMKERGFTVPIIFITGHGTVSQSVVAMKQGAVDFIEKPFEIDRLLNSILNALALDKTRNHERNKNHELQAKIDSLTRREHDVFLLVLKGMLNKQIAHTLGISEKTVKIHRSRMMKKCDAHTIAELVQLYGKLVTV